MLIAFITTLFFIPTEILYRIKWLIAYIAIRLYNASYGRRFDLYRSDADGDPEKLGILIPQIETDLESPQSESHLQEAVDEVFFYGVNSRSECLVVRIIRGCNQEAEAWIYLKLANGKTYHLTEHTQYQQPFEGNCLTFSCGNLQVHYLLPMRRWRIHYCGPLTEKSENKDTPERVVFVKFVFLWTASSNVYDMMADTNESKIASSVAMADWKVPFYPPVHEISEALDFYCQMGNIRGTVSIEEESDYEMYLFGEKLRSLGKISNIAGCKFQHVLGYVPWNGYGYHLITASAPKVFKNLHAGFVINQAGDLSFVNELDITVKPFCSVKRRRDIHANFNTGIKYELSGSISTDPVVLYSSQGWNGSVELSLATFSFMGQTGYGLIMSGEVYNEPIKASKAIVQPLFPKTVPMTVKFTDDISQYGDISGGKGSSLGKLTKLSCTDKTFIVPKGFVVTTSAYEAFLTHDILNSVKHLENVTYGNIEGDMKAACEVVAKNILNTVLPTKISHSIVADLKQVFGNGYKNYKYAVRSSATGEDTDTMSAAGQMDTFLGVQGLQEIFLAVKKCWASQFGHIAIEYKRQNGQLLNSPMAVVIQEMVACDVSGVLFTCDPVNNNPNIITITANYGLGETVVSGSVEPDTIMLDRTSSDHLQIKSINIGSKHQRIVMKDEGGTETEDLPEDSKSNCCITTETAEVLAKLSIRVQKFYRSSRDIEWGIKNGKIYLLQSRPVTSGGAFSDFEIKHEFDTALRSERDYFTVANVGEVMPGAVSPLGMEIVSKFFANALAKEAFKKGRVDSFARSKYYASLTQTFYYHMVVPVIELVSRHGHETMLSKGYMISVFGRPLEEPEIFEIAREKFPDPAPTTLWNDYIFIKELFFYNWGMDKIKKQVDNYSFPFLKCKTSQDTFDALTKSCSDFDDVGYNHLEISGNSSHWNNMIYAILVRSKGGFDTDVYSDVGRILATSSNIESADIPSAMQNVANQITLELGADKFKALSLQEVEKWLNTSNTTAGHKYRQFIERHGHRCLKESDIHSKPWGQDQKTLIKFLQTLAGCTKENTEKSDEDYSKIFSELQVPLNFMDRLCLRFVIPNCRKGVRAREFSKSVVMQCIASWRKGYQHLAKLMVSEGRIPDKDLLYFMTLDEICILLKTRYPKIIARANQRRKLYPVLNEYKFPEIMRGFPKPVNEDDDSTDITEYVADLTMHGTPVSLGIVKGYARVATSLAQAEHLKPGEILIAYSTDIGWSPYFPIISGVVTELGGLISHGAVVSREYGLPCVVGVRGATKQFNTGDFVLLDGKKGILQRLPQPQE